MHRWRSVLALALNFALLSACQQVAQADTISYELTSLPNADSVEYPDYFNPLLTDTLTGTITVTSSQSILGTWNSGNLPSAPISLSYDFSLSNADVSVTHITGTEDLATLISTGHIQGGGLTLTAGGMFMPNPNVSGGEVAFEDGTQLFPPYPLISITWNGNFFAWGTIDNLSGATIQALAGVATVPPVSSLYGSGETWQIATAVPEPSAFVLGCAAAVGLGLNALRKRPRRG